MTVLSLIEFCSTSSFLDTNPFPLIVSASLRLLLPFDDLVDKLLLPILLLLECESLIFGRLFDVFERDAPLLSNGSFLLITLLDIVLVLSKEIV